MYKVFPVIESWCASILVLMLIACTAAASPEPPATLSTQPLEDVLAAPSPLPMPLLTQMKLFLGPKGKRLWQDQSGQILGTVTRDWYSRAFRSYFIFHDVNNERRAEGIQPRGYGVMLSPLTTLHIIDQDANVLLDVKTLLWDGGGARLHYKLIDAEGKHTADAYFDSDYDDQSVYFVSPGKNGIPFAALKRSALSEGSQDTENAWQFTLEDSGIVPNLAWPILLAFCTERSDDVARQKEFSRRISNLSRWRYRRGVLATPFHFRE